MQNRSEKPPRPISSRIMPIDIFLVLYIFRDAPIISFTSAVKHYFNVVTRGNLLIVIKVLDVCTFMV